MATWNETKTGTREWKFKYTRTTNKKPPNKRSKIIGDQYAIKTGKDTYKLILRAKRQKNKRKRY